MFHVIYITFLFLDQIKIIKLKQNITSYVLNVKAVIRFSGSDAGQTAINIANLSTATTVDHFYLY